MKYGGNEYQAGGWYDAIHTGYLPTRVMSRSLRSERSGEGGNAATLDVPRWTGGECAPLPRRAAMAAAGMRTRFAVLDCEDAPKWVGHESVWVAAYGRPGEHWEHFRAWAHELPDLAELDTYQGMVITGR